LSDERDLEAYLAGVEPDDILRLLKEEVGPFVADGANDGSLRFFTRGDIRLVITPNMLGLSAFGSAARRVGLRMSTSRASSRARSNAALVAIRERRFRGSTRVPMRSSKSMAKPRRS